MDAPVVDLNATRAQNVEQLQGLQVGSDAAVLRNEKNGVFAGLSGQQGVDHAPQHRRRPDERASP